MLLWHGRSTIDINQVLIPGMLAIRVDGLLDDEKYEQKQAWQHDRRYSGALRLTRSSFKDPSFHTSLKVKFEHGNIETADRPRTLPPPPTTASRHGSPR